MKWLTPIWHPNINHVNGSVCIDAAWWAASRSLDRLVIMLGEMLQWKNFHDDPTKPPFPWDADAARWSREYRKTHPNAFPLDKRELLRPERVKLNVSASDNGAKADVKLDQDEPEKPKAGVKLSPAQPEKAKAKVNVKISQEETEAKKPSGLVKLKPLDLLKKKPKIRLK